MKTFNPPTGAMTTRSLATLALMLAAVPVYAGTEAAAPSAKAGDIRLEPTPSRWRFGVSYAPIFGLETRFDGLGTFNGAFTPQPIAPGTNYDYDDGFVHVDSSGNLGGQTWNWGYENASQFDGGRSIAMSNTSSNADAHATEDGDVAHGIDLFTYLDMGKVGIPGLADRGATWGFRAGLHYARVGMDNSRTLNSSTTIVRDTFTSASGVVPGAPYTGSFSGPGPLLNETPSRDFLTGSAVVSGNRDLDVHLAILSLGAYLEIPVTRDFHVMLEGGLSAAYASGDYDFKSSTTIAGLGTAESSGSASDNKILPGLYLGLSGTYQLDPHWSLQLSGRYQYMDDFSLKDNGSEAKLSFDSAFIVSFGVLYAF